MDAWHNYSFDKGYFKANFNKSSYPFIIEESTRELKKNIEMYDGRGKPPSVDEGVASN